MISEQLLPCDFPELHCTACERHRVVEFLYLLAYLDWKLRNAQDHRWGCLTWKNSQEIHDRTGSSCGNFPILFHRFPVP